MKKAGFIVIMLMLYGHCSYAQWSTSGSNIYYNTGNVAIGPNSFPGLFTVQGSGILATTYQALFTDGTRFLKIGVNATAAEIQSTGGVPLYLNYSGNNVIINGNNGTGLVGIGITNPQEALTIANSNGSTLGLYRSEAGGVIGYGGTIGQINLGVLNTTNSTEALGAQITGLAMENWTPGSAQGSAISFSTTTNASTNLMERMRIDNNGNVSIGNTAVTPINASSPLFPSAIPKAEILTGVGTTPYSDVVTIRHVGLNSATGPYQLGLLLKLSSESTTAESTKMGGLLLESNNSFSNAPSLSLLINNGRQLTILSNGNIGIGSTSPSNKLDVNGTVHSKQVNVDLNGWSDYVFDKDYQLPGLYDVKAYIDRYHHLPEIPSEKQVLADGLNLGEINKLLVKKVEELTLYLIAQDKQLNDSQAELKQQQAINKEQQDKLNAQQLQIDLMKQELDLIVKQLNKK